MADVKINRTIELEAQTDKLDTLLTLLEKDLEAAECPQETRTVVEICAEEIFVNIASYAYGEETGMARIEERIEERRISICFQDRGTPYNPLEKKDPDTTLSAEDRQIGGLGIFMVKNMMDTVEYAYEDGCNRLTMTLSW